jgi:hypothetical protein
MNKIKFEETNNKVLNGFWQGLAGGTVAGVVIGSVVVLT